ncbi:hypothetical protein RUND412_010624 [Rhizina undulata]
MSSRPVCITEIVESNPPDGLESHSSPVLSLGLWLAMDQNFVCMQDKDGKVWAVHRNNPFGLFLPPGGHQLFASAVDDVEYFPWYRKMFIDIRSIGRKPLTSSLPYAIAVRNWYAGYADGVNPDPTVHSEMQIPLRAVNGYVAFRTWFNDDIKSGGYHLTQADISSLCGSMWTVESTKHIWIKTAKLYTAARDQGTAPCLPDFARIEFMKHGIVISAAKLVESMGYDLVNLNNHRSACRKSQLISTIGAGVSAGSCDRGPPVEYEPGMSNEENIAMSN